MRTKFPRPFASSAWLSALVVLTGFSGISSADDPDPEDRYFAALEHIRREYRTDHAKVISQGDRAVLYLLKFDGSKKIDELEGVDEEKYLPITPYGTQTDILDQKLLGDEERKELLSVLTKQISKPKQSGGAFCHAPIHGLRVYRGEKLLYEGSFCWMCENFSFDYPTSATWLDTTKEMEQLFTRLMPIPESEVERFKKGLLGK